MIIQDYPEAAQATMIVLFYFIASVASASVLGETVFWICRTLKRMGEKE